MDISVGKEEKLNMIGPPGPGCPPHFLYPKSCPTLTALIRLFPLPLGFLNPGTEYFLTRKDPSPLRSL